MLSESFGHRYHNVAVFGMQSRNCRGESSRRGYIIGSRLGRTSVDIARPTVSKLIEADGLPLVDTDGLKAMIRSLRVVQPLYKGQLLRLFLNLCAHRDTRKPLVQILMDMLMLDLCGPVSSKAGASKQPFRLYGCQSYSIYSRPQFFDGVPPLVSRRILKILTYLAQNHHNVAKSLLLLELPYRHACEAGSSDQGRGKAVMMEEDEPEDSKGHFSIVLLLSLSNQPLYMSVAHLEQVVLVNAELRSTNQSNLYRLLRNNLGLKVLLKMHS